MRYLTAAEARDLGVLLEVNRRGLHPRGLALELSWNGDDLNGTAILRVQDHRDDPEGVYFDVLDDEDCERADRFDGLLAAIAETRHAALGYVEQPLPDQVPPGNAVDVVVKGKRFAIVTNPLAVDAADLLPHALAAAGWEGGDWDVRDADGEQLYGDTPLEGRPQPLYIDPPPGADA